ncbi:serine decarboxylase-like isoform X1 [Trifolium pratense]|nr:serine decarboxylase-like isoform X1 [Trifolium pratense]XP_045812118.1 serine decarboxylase-like isoform X1 [Trifolium pratense]
MWLWLLSFSTFVVQILQKLKHYSICVVRNTTPNRVLLGSKHHRTLKHYSTKQDMMETLEGNNMTMIHDAIVLKEEAIVHENIHEQNNITSLTNLAITQCIGETDTNLDAIITRYADTISNYNLRNLGYPTNQNFNYNAFAPLLNFHLNNAGDPFLGSSFSLNSMTFEVSVLDWFAKLWEIEKNDYWGYVTTGGTEGNLHGILVGRENFPGGILYTSEDSHYSIPKIARMYRMQCVKVGSLISGEIDCVDLEASLLANKDKPAIINLNIGTTLKGAIDDIDLVIQTLYKCGFTRDRFYIHCDGALFGIMLPFIEQAPRISFKKPIDSVTISGHKFLGCPSPCGVLITRLKYIDALSSECGIIASRDATITGSRSGHSPIFLWYALTKRGLIGLENEVHNCLMKSRYLLNLLRDAGIGAMLNEFSNVVAFEKPQDDQFTRRWNLASNENIAHVVVLQHVTIEMLDNFVGEFVQKRLICSKDGQKFQPLCIANDVGSRNCACSMHNVLRNIY